MSAESASALYQDVEDARLHYFIALVEAAEAKLAYVTADARAIGADAYDLLACAHLIADNDFSECAKHLQSLLALSGPLSLDQFALSRFIEITFEFELALELLQSRDVDYADTYMGRTDPIRLDIPPGRYMAAIFNHDYTRGLYREYKSYLIYRLSDSDKRHEVLISELMSAEAKEASIEYQMSEHGWQDSKHYEWFVGEWEQARISYRETLALLVEWRNQI